MSRAKLVAAVVVTTLVALLLGGFLAWRYSWVWALAASPILLLAIGLAVQASGALSRGEEETP